ncbi:hypothetical protein AAVH_28007 [Aphelenchoides avenae]|nr:hypothetical protein AAVH_28007 [Aphelenchus avenae]
MYRLAVLLMALLCASEDDLPRSSRTNRANYELQASDDVCTGGCAGSGEKGFCVQLTHHCEHRNHRNLTVEIPKENQGDSENDVKLFMHDFLIVLE